MNMAPTIYSDSIHLTPNNDYSTEGLLIISESTMNNQIKTVFEWRGNLSTFAIRI